MSDDDKPHVSQWPDDESSDSPRQLVLIKGGQQYVFRYERGEETKLLNHLVVLAGDPSSDLDWFDAAVLSHQVGQRMGQRLEDLMRSI
ncbi:MAG: hypothetical protein V3U29_06820 [Phycisphaeraceae bacterium]